MQNDGKKILIVEDERPLAKALELKLGKEGFTTAIASNGEEALKLLSENRYDVVILDLVMPRFDGFYVLDRVKAQNIPVRVIVLSNLSQDEDVKKAQGFGAADYFVKSDTPIVSVVEHIKRILAS